MNDALSLRREFPGSIRFEKTISVAELKAAYEAIRSQLAFQLLQLQEDYRAVDLAEQRGELNTDQVFDFLAAKILRAALAQGLPGGDDPDREPL